VGVRGRHDTGRVEWIAAVLVLVGFVVTWEIYLRQRDDQRSRDRDVALSVLRAVRDGIVPWGDLYFSESYEDESAKERARQDYDWIMKGSYGEIFCVQPPRSQRC
jgi:hypothetical protein